MHAFRFDPVDLPEHIPLFRRQVREFLAQELPPIPPERRANSWFVFDPSFSRKLGARGWIGLTWPKRYGGQERTAIERYVLLEELLAAGAPVGAHWIADRQSGPALLRFGTEDQRMRYLPGMASGEEYCCIGMSEPNAGSDLAAVRTRAERLTGGRWRINGQKIWTSNAHNCRSIIALIRTGAHNPESRQAGLSQFVLELNTPGITVRPIRDLTGASEFNEVFFEDVVVPADALLGREGEGWAQVTSELSLERSGPERYLSSFALLVELMRHPSAADSELVCGLVGRLSTELWTLRQMSLAVAGQLAAGEDPALEAVIVKDLGNSFEQDLPLQLQGAVAEDFRLESDEPLARILAMLLQASPSFSLRGGTREILRGIVARGLGLR